MFTLYSMQRSGNSYKARLALAQLNIPYRLVEIDILKGESHTPEFLTKNPNGQVPLLEVAPGRFLAESNAILWYIAGGSPLAPDDRIERAETLQWMFFEQHSLEPNLGAAYFWLTLVKGGRDLQRHAFEDWMEEGHRALGVMENHIALHDFFAADRYTIADIRSTPIRTWRICVTSISARTLRFARGWRASPPNLITSRWTSIGQPRFRPQRGREPARLGGRKTSDASNGGRVQRR